MSRGRLEAFSDGVIAIIITIMVLELKPPEAVSLDALGHLTPKLLSYLLSFTFVAIYWNNHHHLMHVVEKVDGGVLWANMHLLFWLSLTPFVTAWLGENHLSPVPVAIYGVVLLVTGFAYFVLVQALRRLHTRDSKLVRAIGNDWKGKASLVIYVAGVGLAFVSCWLAIGCYAAVAVMWLVPDRRIERLAAAAPP